MTPHVFSPAQKIKNHYLAQKLNFLLNILHESQTGYEEISSGVNDKNIQKAIVGLAMECSQYVSELSSQISSLGSEPKKDGVADQAYPWYSTASQNCGEILNVCGKRESLIVKAYREVLNDPSLNQHLRARITYQLNGILYAFVRVKLLNSATRH